MDKEINRSFTSYLNNIRLILECDYNTYGENWRAVSCRWNGRENRGSEFEQPFGWRDVLGGHLEDPKCWENKGRFLIELHQVNAAYGKADAWMVANTREGVLNAIYTLLFMGPLDKSLSKNYYRDNDCINHHYYLTIREHRGDYYSAHVVPPVNLWLWNRYPSKKDYFPGSENWRGICNSHCIDTWLKDLVM